MSNEQLPSFTYETKVHPHLAKYNSMLFAGVSTAAVNYRFVNDMFPDIDSRVFAVPMAPTPVTYKAKDHPKYAKYFRMLNAGIPAEAIQMKMKQDGLLPSILDEGPETDVPYIREKGVMHVIGAPTGTVRYRDVKYKQSAGIHPMYARYFKMAKVGISEEEIFHAMRRDGADPNVFKQGPDTLIECTRKEMYDPYFGKK